MSEDDKLISVGGFCAPESLLYGGTYPLRRGDTFTVTYQVQGRLRRWWFRRKGYSTEWTQEHTYVPVTDLIPRMTAVRGGIEYAQSRPNEPPRTREPKT